MDNTTLKKMRLNINLTLEKLKKRAKELKKNISLLYAVYKHVRTPWYAKVVIIITIAYALSPIDLIPDFIPILGYLDDILIVPAGIALSIRLVPKEIVEECRQSQEKTDNIRQKGIYGAIIIILFWVWITSLLLKVFYNK